MPDMLRVGEVAERAGVSPDTVRHYEELGLVPKAARTANGYRVYSASVVRAVIVVRNGLRIGFSLKELARFVQARDDGRAPCHDVRAAAARHLERLDHELRELQALQLAMRTLIKEWDERLAGTPTGRPARLLDLLHTLDVPASTARSVRRPRRQRGC